ncbi:glycosyl hydrolase family 65 protein [Microbulbifer taiwanensis]
MRLHGEELSFNPYVPDGLAGYRFRLQFRGRTLELDVDGEQTSYTLVSGEPITLRHCDEILWLSEPGQSLAIDRAPARELAV